MDVLFDFRFHQIYRHALTSFTALYQAIKRDKEIEKKS